VHFVAFYQIGMYLFNDFNHVALVWDVIRLQRLDNETALWKYNIKYYELSELYASMTGNNYHTLPKDKKDNCFSSKLQNCKMPLVELIIFAVEL
jgi:hypothetical protein